MRKIHKDIFETICSRENLILAWRRVENSYHHGDVWFDELELSAYKFNLLNNIEKLSEKMKTGTYQMRPIKPAPYPKGKKVVKDDGGNEHEKLRVRQSFCIHVEDQIVWMAVYGVLGPYFEEDMPAWSYGNRLFLNTWKDENGHWINGVYRTTSKLFYRKWQQGWPLYRHMLAACIKRKAFPGKKDEEICDDSVLESIAENEAQVNKAFKLPYLEKDYFPKEGYHPKLFYMAIDLEKFYPSVKMDRIKTILLNSFPIHNPNFTALINAITKFDVAYDGFVGQPFSDDELAEMDLYKDVVFDGLPTGLLVAGALANLYLLEIDLKVAERLRKDDKHYILHFRYVDDHLFLSEDKEKLIEWKDWYIQELNKIGLNVNAAKTDTKPIELDSRYPTPLLTQTLHKISEIAKMPLDLLSTNEFSMVFRDLQMLLVTDFPEQEVKKGTRTSFACTMLSRLVSDINVDYDKIHQLRKRWLECIFELKLNAPAKERMLRSVIFTKGDDYPEKLEEPVLKLVNEKGNKIYISIRDAIGDSRKEILKIEEKIFNLLVYSVREIPDKPKMWLRILDFCIFHLPDKIPQLYLILNNIHEDGCIHSLGYEYIVSVMDIHLALQVLKAISRLSANKYKDPWKKITDEKFLRQFAELKDIYNGTHHYLYTDARFLKERVRRTLKKYIEKEEENDYLADCNYHGIELDSSFWLLWHIDRFNKSKPSPNLLIPNFLMKDLDKANIVSPYFTQLLFSSISYVPLSKFGKQDFSKLKLDRLQKENLLLSVWGLEEETMVVKGFGLPEKKMSSPNNKISLLQWIREVKKMAEKQNDVLGNALCSEYCATLIMKSVVKFFLDGIEHIESVYLHPASILVKREECLKPKDWDSWLSSQKEIEISIKDSFLDTMYRYPSFSSNDYSPMIGAIYGLGIIFLQLLTKEFSLPWVFNRPEYGYEWQSVLYRLLEKGKVSSHNYDIISACLSLENRETIKLKGILNDVACAQQVNDAKIETLEELLNEIEASLAELKENQISVAHHETRQLVMIKI